MFFSLIFVPLTVSFFILIFSRFLGNKGTGIICFLNIFLLHLISISCFFDGSLNQSVIEFQLFNWISDSYFLINWNFIFDNFNGLILIMISGVSCLIRLYSLEYMSNDPHQSRFMVYLTLFTFSMIVLVTSENLIQLFFGWEAIGVCSFLLISF